MNNKQTIQVQGRAIAVVSVKNAGYPSLTPVRFTEPSLPNRIRKNPAAAAARG